MVSKDDNQRAAVLVIDMVRDFADPNGRVFNEGAGRIVPVIDRFLDAARATGAVIIWVIDSHRPGKPDWELQNVRSHCEGGTPGVELMPPLEPEEADYVITKPARRPGELTGEKPAEDRQFRLSSSRRRKSRR